MRRPEELARRFLILADRDIKAFHKLSDDPEMKLDSEAGDDGLAHSAAS
jgi:hypothetical protein